MPLPVAEAPEEEVEQISESPSRIALGNAAVLVFPKPPVV